jgi:hypothetical protein
MVGGQDAVGAQRSAYAVPTLGQVLANGTAKNRLVPLFLV